MNSRERVLAAVNHRTPDRVPIDLGGLKASGIASIAYDRVKQRLGIRTPTRVSDARFMIAEVEDAVRERFRLDVAPLDWTTVFQNRRPDAEWVPRRLFDGTPVLFPPETRMAEEPDGAWVLLKPDGTPTTYRMPKGGYYFDDTSFNRVEEGICPEEFRPVRDIPDEQLAVFAAHARQLYEGTDYALLGWGFGVCFLGLSLITDRRSNVTMGMPDEWMMMLMTEKETCHEMMGRAVDASIRCLTLMHQAVGDRCFGWGIAADDSGTQRGEFIKTELWAEMIKPHYARLCHWIHHHTNWKIFLHCCGSIYHLIPHFIDAGIDILNPIQTSAANMDPARLKAEFGSRLTLWGGGADTQRVLPTGTPEEIREHVRERMRIFSPGGGYVFNQVHNIQANVPPENVIAMLDAAAEFGGYG